MHIPQVLKQLLILFVPLIHGMLLSGVLGNSSVPYNFVSLLCKQVYQVSFFTF